MFWEMPGAGYPASPAACFWALLLDWLNWQSVLTNRMKLVIHLRLSLHLRYPAQATRLAAAQPVHFTWHMSKMARLQGGPAAAQQQHQRPPVYHRLYTAWHSSWQTDATLYAALS